MPLPRNYSKMLWNLSGLTDEEKRLIEEEFDCPNVSPGKWILSDIRLVAIRLKDAGRIYSDVPAYDTMKEVLEKVCQSEREEVERAQKEKAEKERESRKNGRKERPVSKTGRTGSLRQGEKYEEAISSLFDLPRREDFNSDEDYLAALPKTEEPTWDDEPGQPVSRADAGDRISKRMKVLRRTQVSLVLLVLMFYLGKVFLNLDTKIDAYWVDSTITILVCCLAVSLLVKVFINGKS